MEEEEFFKIYKQVRNNKYNDLGSLDFKTLHKINTMLLYEIELKKLQKPPKDAFFA